MLKKFGVLICSVILAIAPWAKSLPDFGAMVEPQNLWVGLPIVAGVLLAWLGQSPVKPKI